MNTVSRRVGLASTLLLLALPGIASAAPGGRNFQVTYPIASKLCTEASLPKSLQGEQSQVTALCSTLETSYNAAVTAGQAAETSFSTAVMTARAAAQAACTPTPTTVAGRQACRQARLTAHHEVVSQRNGLRLALRQFHVSLEQARITFWTAIHGLRGGAGIPADGSIPPTTSLPPAAS